MYIRTQRALAVGVSDLDSSSILKVCRNERKICGGYHWEFINKENNIG